MELDNNNEVLSGEQSEQNSPDLETETGLESTGGYGLRDGALYNLEDSDEEQPKDEEAPVETSPSKVYKVKYNQEEIEVPEDELLNGYMRHRDFTQKTQELALERQRIQAELEQSRMRTPAPQAPAPVQEEMSPAKVLEGLVNRAQASAMQTLGITDAEEFDHWNPVHRTAYDLAMQNLVNGFREQEAKLQTVRSFESKLTSTDPDYVNVRNFATENLKYLPQHEYQRFQDGFAQGNTEVMNELYTKMKKAYNIYYGKESPSAPASTQSVQERARVLPPTIESGKGLTPQAEKPKRDYSALRGMSFDEQIKQLKDWGVKV